MVDVLSRRRRRRAASSMLPAALDYGTLGWPVCRGAEPASSGARACSCDRLGCPAPASHPLSAAWGLEAAVDPAVINRWWGATPQANIVLPTGRVFDVFDVPTEAGVLALARLARVGVEAGPVASLDDRYLFFVSTRGAPVDEDEWWSCQLDCSPSTVQESPGLRWHCRDSYILAPPSRLPSGRQVTWIRSPGGRPGPVPLPDPIAVLDVLADTCGE